MQRVDITGKILDVGCGTAVILSLLSKDTALPALNPQGDKFKNF